MIYPYLEDKNFLKRLDLEEKKTTYIRITILNFITEDIVTSIEGVATGGNINLNGNSNMRRTMSCSMIVIPDGIETIDLKKIKYNNITEIENIISLNKKIKVEIGFKNSLSWDEQCYPEYDIIWIPLGLYIIKNPSVSKNASGINISLTLSDKCALLNGDAGGVIPAAVILSEQESYSLNTKQRKVEKVLFKDIIRNLVVDFGGEKPDNVIIEDVPDTVRKVMKWTGSEPLYFDKNKNIYITDKPSHDNYQEFQFGQDCGYMVEPFYYPGKLSCNAGDTVSTMLDKVKNTLGNYEWYYDIWGKFHFQQKKNYIQEPNATNIIEFNEYNYLSIMNLNKSIYTFDDSNKKLLVGISSSPQYSNIKNDFVVWGSTKTATGATKPIRYHLAFDSKPVLKKERLCIIYTDYRNLQQVIVLNNQNMRIGLPASDSDLSKDLYYIANDNTIVHWDDENNLFRAFPEWELCYLITDDWRTELYFLGLENPNNYYAAELSAEWPKIYDVKKNVVKDGDFGKVYSGGYREIEPSAYEYFLDFIEGDEGGDINLSQFNVNNIGRRSTVGKDNSSNCIFSTAVPDVFFININNQDSYLDYENITSGYTVIQIDEKIFEKLAIGGNTVSAYDKIQELLVQHTNYNEGITLTSIPIYYLEPNTIIRIEDNDIGLNGDYLINTISLPLTIGTSNISCSRAPTREIKRTIVPNYELFKAKDNNHSWRDYLDYLVIKPNKEKEE